MGECGGRTCPLAGHADRFAAAALASGGRVRIAEQPFRAQLDLRVDPRDPAVAGIAAALGTALPVEPGTTAAAGGVEVAWLGPDEWLVVGDPGAERELGERLRAAAGDAHVSVVDVSAQRTTLRLAGEAARDVLAHGCALDLHPRAFGTGRCASTMLARAQVVLVARDGDTFDVLVRSSYARYLADWLLDAATEHTTPS